MPSDTRQKCLVTLGKNIVQGHMSTDHASRLSCASRFRSFTWCWQIRPNPGVRKQVHRLEGEAFSRASRFIFRHGCAASRRRTGVRGQVHRLEGEVFSRACRFIFIHGCADDVLPSDTRHLCLVTLGMPSDTRHFCLVTLGMPSDTGKILPSALGRGGGDLK